MQISYDSFLFWKLSHSYDENLSACCVNVCLLSYQYLEVPVDHHVYKLQDVKEWGGHTEIIAMARLFK